MGSSGGSSSRSGGRTGTIKGGGGGEYVSLEQADTEGLIGPDDIEKGLRVTRKDLGVQFTQAEVDAVVEYTSGITEAMNRLLRGTLATQSDALRAQAQQAVAGLNSAIAKSPGLDRNRVLFRGMTMTPQQFAALRPGGRFTEAAFGSTSLSNKVSANFISGNQSADRPLNVMLRIRAKKGTRGVYANAVHRKNEYSGEVEFIMAPDTSYRVTGYGGRKKHYGISYNIINVEVD